MLWNSFCHTFIRLSAPFWRGKFTPKKVKKNNKGEYGMKNRKQSTFMAIIAVFGIIISFIACDNGKNDEDDDIDPSLKIVEGFTFDNFPKVDGSTSAEPLNILIACKLLGIKHQWVQNPDNDSWGIEPILKSEKNIQRFSKLIKTSQTHQSIINVIDKKADITISARKMSPDEKTYADSAGVSLIETPIALDAFVFIINPNNPISSLTIKQIQDIYTGKITNWKAVGADDIDWTWFDNFQKPEIKPYVRNQNSGSQELMESMVMKDLDIMEFPTSDEVVIQTMQGALEKVAEEFNAICYTVYYFKEFINKESPTKGIGIEGIYPNRENISNNTYPLVAEVYAVIRSDLDTTSMAYKLYELLQTEKGKEVISESGYVPN
jgi:phosphate transport system substrate-binding protein